MPGKNCFILGCPVSRRSKYKGLSIFSVPSGNSEFETTWRNNLISIVTSRDRVIDSKLREQVNNKHIYICQQHYRTDQYIIHDTCKTLKPGEIPGLNLPVKSILSSQPVPRSSAESISTKRQKHIPPISTTVLCYKSYDDFKNRIDSLNLPSSWEIVYTNAMTTTTTTTLFLNIMMIIFTLYQSIKSIQMILFSLKSDIFCGSYQIIMKSIQHILILLKI